MRSVSRRGAAPLAALLLIVLAAGCGKKQEETGEGGKEETAASSQTQPKEELPTEAVPFAPEIEAAGFTVVYYKAFPPALSGHKGKMILYRSAGDGGDGGMVFVEELGPQFKWLWHWYFPDASPKTMKRLEVNKDGMWDIRVYTTDGRSFDLIQDDSFSLRGPGRDDRIALNGTCSEPLPGHPLWQCFDGSDKTSWQSPLDGDRKPFIEVANPLGLADGILVLDLLPVNQPKDIDVLADGKKIQTITLEPDKLQHRIQLEPAARTARRIRLEIESCRGNTQTAAIAELEIR